MSKSTLNKIDLLFKKKKEEIKEQDNNNAITKHAPITDSTRQQQDIQKSIMNDLMNYTEKPEKVSKKIKKNKDKRDDKDRKRHKSDTKDQKVPTKEMKDPVTIRQIAGTIWEDPTMADWPKDDYRLFVGNLGNEVTDTVLSNAFRKYKSFSRARVVRDKRSLKTKGYGFVSLKDAQDYLKCYKEMNGAYVGNRPCKIEASRWQDRQHEYKKDDEIVAQFKKLNKKKNLYRAYGY